MTGIFHQINNNAIYHRHHHQDLTIGIINLVIMTHITVKIKQNGKGLKISSHRVK